MRELKELICYFITNAPHKLNKTEVVKMVYMFEYYHVQTYGIQYSDVQFIRHNYGPYAYEIEHVLDELIALNYINLDIIEYPDRKVYLHSPRNNNVVELYNLCNEKTYIADRVLAELSCKSYDDMINIVYSTPPMARIIAEEERIGSKLHGEVLNMGESKKIKKFTREQLKAARKRRLAQEVRGTDEEYYAHLIDQFNRFEDLRRRASQCQM